MKWLKNILGINDQQNDLNELKSSLGESIKLLKDSLDEIKSVKAVSDKNETALQSIEGSLEISFNKNYYKIIKEIEKKLSDINDSFNSEIDKKLLNTEKSISSKLENQHLKELEEIKEKTKFELNSIKQEVTQVLEILNPKPVPIDFKLVDPLDNSVELFSFHKILEPTYGHNKLEVKNGKSILSNLVGSIPELTSVGLLANSYCFVFPEGAIGKVMQIGSGQGTAIMQKGRIIAHGSYIPNALLAAPLAIYTIGSMIVRQHYLNKIHKKLKYIEIGLDNLIKLVFVDKRSRIDSIIYFFKKSFHEYDNVNTNLNYKNAILTNLIAKNIEVYELIQFYANSIHLTKNYKSETNSYDFENNVKSFIELQELFLFGKMLSFMYSNLFDNEINEDLKKELREVSDLYIKVLNQNSKEISSVLNQNNPRMQDWWLNRKRKKEIIRGQTIQDLLTLEVVKSEVNGNFEKGQNLISDLIFQIEKPQEFVIEQGQLYQVN
ncbi:hypothetical protein [Bizionia sp. M204]|uniref:hypothetical protein n=1 Tax=Bizionia sp. M204 TaxID=2675331 RepID=UPI00205B8D0A|nr:hypothetical protein [Bizionia sp. M204]UPS91394.1 hypothetical protein GMA17_06500 [Bizionia sp. M204]